MSKEPVAKLPSMEHKFSIQIQGSDTQQMFIGEFMYRRPNIAEKSMIEQMRVRLNGDLKTLSNDVAINNEALSYLKFTIKEAPEWWSNSNHGASLHDENVLFEIYNKVIVFEAEWRKKVYGGKSEEVSES
jgi:hypothetical protein